MPREVTDETGTVWSCVQAFAGLGNDAAKREAATDVDGHVAVVCTPGGGARSVRLQLPPEWEGMAEMGLLARIADAS